MAESKLNSTSLAAVPDETQQTLLASTSDVKTRLGPVAKFNVENKFQEKIDLDNVDVDNTNKEFLGLTKEELKEYIQSEKWKRMRMIIAVLYLLVIVLLLVGSVFLVWTSPRCPPKKQLHWYEREIIYEVDVSKFRDSNEDGIGDIQGLVNQMEYIEKNRIQTILLQSSIFNVSLGTSTILDGSTPSNIKFDLLQIDPKIGNQTELDTFVKNLQKKNMHVIIDLPLSSTYDPNGYLWYGDDKQLSKKIPNPCSTSKSSLGCRYYESYGRLPLDFNLEEVTAKAEDRLTFWLSNKKFDGVRVDLPLEFDSQIGVYKVSNSTMMEWAILKKKIEEKSKTKLLIFDVPSVLHELIDLEGIPKEFIVRPIYSSKISDPSAITAHQLVNNFDFSAKEQPNFWRLGSRRSSDELSVPKESQISREILLTLMMLVGPTPVLLYGDELSLDQRNYPYMPWTPDKAAGGFTNCSAKKCPNFYTSYKENPAKISVKRQEAFGGQSKDTLLNVYRRLAALRTKDSFLFGKLVSGHDDTTNSFWFVREAPGHPGYAVVLNLHATESAHLSLDDLSGRQIPYHVHYEYQWPTVQLPTSNSTFIISHNLVISPQSINIFWWKPRLMEKN